MNTPMDIKELTKKVQKHYPMHSVKISVNNWMYHHSKKFIRSYSIAVVGNESCLYHEDAKTLPGLKKLAADIIKKAGKNA